MMENPQIILISGGNAGLGYAFTKLLAESSHACHVLMGTRSLSKGQAASSAVLSAVSPTTKTQITPIQLDVTDPSSIAAAKQTISTQFGHIDALVNNAGIAAPSDPTLSVVDQYRAVFETNVFGVAALTEAFLPLLSRSSTQAQGTTHTPRLVFVSSGLGSLAYAADPDKPYYAIDAVPYRASKSALNMLMLQHAKTLGKEGKDTGGPIKVFGLCPGFCATDLGGDPEAARKYGAVEPEVGAQVIVDVVLGKRDADVGKVVYAEGVREW